MLAFAWCSAWANVFIHILSFIFTFPQCWREKAGIHQTRVINPYYPVIDVRLSFMHNTNLSVCNSLYITYLNHLLYSQISFSAAKNGKIQNFTQSSKKRCHFKVNHFQCFPVVPNTKFYIYKNNLISRDLFEPLCFNTWFGWARSQSQVSIFLLSIN